jgi:hypothetical protein
MQAIKHKIVVIDKRPGCAARDMLPTISYATKKPSAAGIDEKPDVSPSASAGEQSKMKIWHHSISSGDGACAHH